MSVDGVSGGGGSSYEEDPVQSAGASAAVDNTSGTDHADTSQTATDTASAAHEGTPDVQEAHAHDPAASDLESKLQGQVADKKADDTKQAGSKGAATADPPKKPDAPFTKDEFKALKEASAQKKDDLAAARRNYDSEMGKAKTPADRARAEERLMGHSLKAESNFHQDLRKAGIHPDDVPTRWTKTPGDGVANPSKPAVAQQPPQAAAGQGKTPASASPAAPAKPAADGPKTTTSADGKTKTTTDASEKKDDKGRVTSRESNKTVETDDGKRQTRTETKSKDTYTRESKSSSGVKDGKAAAEKSASYAEQHDRSYSKTSQPTGGKSATDIADDAKKNVLGGKELYKKEGKVSADATAYQKSGSAEVSGKAGTVKADYDVKLAQAHAEASGSATVTSRGAVVQGEAKAEVNLIDAKGHVGYESPKAGPFSGKVDADVRAHVGAEAHAKGELVVDPLHGRVAVGGEVGASAVAKIEGSVKAQPQYTDSKGETHSLGSITASGYASAGAEAQAHAHIGFDKGKISFDLGAGAALGLGLGGGVKGEIDLNEVKNAAVDMADKATGGAITAAKTAVEDAKKEVENVVDEVKNAPAKALESAKSTVLGWFS